VNKKTGVSKESALLTPVFLPLVYGLMTIAIFQTFVMLNQGLRLETLLLNFSTSQLLNNNQFQSIFRPALMYFFTFNQKATTK
jgi:hypothetical protein